MNVSPIKSPLVIPGTSDRVFVVHGHDNYLREAVARFLENQGLQPIILHEQTDGGQTVIEKVESHADVAFAIILLTADDVGAAKASADNLKPRARQNVIFEWGYMIGRLGRKYTCAIYEEGVEKPSDMEGIAWIPYDQHEAWKFRIAKELRAAGFEIDLNRLG